MADMTLKDDIARVARLRGRDPSNYLRETTGVETLASKLGVKRVRSIFFAPTNPTLDIQVYDALPLASRAQILRVAGGRWRPSCAHKPDLSGDSNAH